MPKCGKRPANHVACRWKRRNVSGAAPGPHRPHPFPLNAAAGRGQPALREKPVQRFGVAPRPLRRVPQGHPAVPAGSGTRDYWVRQHQERTGVGQEQTAKLVPGPWSVAKTEGPWQRATDEPSRGASPASRARGCGPPRLPPLQDVPRVPGGGEDVGADVEVAMARGMGMPASSSSRWSVSRKRAPRGPYAAANASSTMLPSRPCGTAAGGSRRGRRSRGPASMRKPLSSPGARRVRDFPNIHPASPAQAGRHET
jgi:hypothetical protein